MASCRPKGFIGCIETQPGAGQILFEPECSGGDFAPGRSNRKKSPSLFQTLFGKGCDGLQPSSGSLPKAQMNITGRRGPLVEIPHPKYDVEISAHVALRTFA